MAAAAAAREAAGVDDARALAADGEEGVRAAGALEVLTDEEHVLVGLSPLLLPLLLLPLLVGGVASRRR